MIDNLVVKRSPPAIWVSCTYCWQMHPAHRDGDRLVVTTSTCGFDPRRYFLRREDYIAYVRRYKAKGHRHIDEWEEWQLEMDSLVSADA